MTGMVNTLFASIVVSGDTIRIKDSVDIAEVTTEVKKMRCIDYEYSQYLDGTYFCNIWKRSYRISREDVQKDVPCWKYDRRRKMRGERNEIN